MTAPPRPVAFETHPDRYRHWKLVCDGPVATLSSPHGETVPFLLHAAWMPRAVAADPSIERLRFADELSDDRLAQLPPDLATLAVDVATQLG